jgi:hypothetical protein
MLTMEVKRLFALTVARSIFERCHTDNLTQNYVHQNNGEGIA